MKVIASSNKLSVHNDLWCKLYLHDEPQLVYTSILLVESFQLYIYPYVFTYLISNKTVRFLSIT